MWWAMKIVIAREAAKSVISIILIPKNVLKYFGTFWKSKNAYISLDFEQTK